VAGVNLAQLLVVVADAGKQLGRLIPVYPAANLLYKLREALCMLRTEGLDNVFVRRRRLAETARACLLAMGLEILCRCPEEYSNVLIAVVIPERHDADAFRKVVLDRFNMSLETGLGGLKGRVFCIGHLGDFNELMLCGTLRGVEMGLASAGARTPWAVCRRRWDRLSV
jgi:alanine-glyoxylate transaminase/serine-glyoxylate transaminase/serine-pyruvate transaminase